MLHDYISPQNVPHEAVYCYFLFTYVETVFFEKSGELKKLPRGGNSDLTEKYPHNTLSHVLLSWNLPGWGLGPENHRGFFSKCHRIWFTELTE